VWTCAATTDVMRWRPWATTLVVAVAGLVPAARILRDWLMGRFTDPVDEITLRTGWWALFFLTATLAISPVRRITGWNALIRQRRTLGLLAFTYATLHFSTYIVLDQFFGWSFILEDIAERPYITVGFTAWLLLLPMALTSTRGWIRRLGKRWIALHALIYLIAGLAVLHFSWLVKADLREPTIFGLVLAALLAVRLLRKRRGRTPA
ncbi:MAG: protein-methionine-sulfoxide reductase heme-binding subunit MsrQ, partial [Gemmatimonadales bacterium]